MQVSSRARHALKAALRPLLFRYPPVGLQPERLMVWLQTIERTRDVPGTVLEIGCSVGGTTAVSHRLMRNLQIRKPYLALDTFGGFVDEQFSDDTGSQTPEHDRHMFSANSRRLVRRNLDAFGAHDVELLQADVVTVPSSRLPRQVSACLVDVDLSGPVYAALQKVVPLLAPGGVVVVDDCGEDITWRAREAYSRFVTETGRPEIYVHGFGVVEAPSA